MRILQIVMGLQKASGITTFIENVADELRKQGHPVDILTKASFNAESLSLNSYDVIHLHGLWSPWLHAIAKKIRAFRRSSSSSPALIWSPHGMLQTWALKNKWYKKLPALALYQWHDLHSADLLHATAPSEVEDIRRLGLRNRVVIAPLGVRIVGESKSRVEVEQRKVKTLLFVSRVQRKKGLPNLIDAWSRLPVELRKDWQVRIVGPDEDNHTAELMSQCARLGIAYIDLANRSTTTTSNYNFVFTGPKYGDELAAEYAAADLFVLPTHSENFGSVVIEALAYGVPVITTKGTPWAELESSKRCGWWIDVGVEPLVVALKEAVGLSTDQLRAMGERGRTLVDAKYTWQAAAKKMLTGYADVV